MRGDAGQTERYAAQAIAADPDDRVVDGICWASRGAVVLLRGDAAAAVEPYARGMAILARLPHAEPAGLRALWPLLLAALGDHRAARAIGRRKEIAILRAMGARARSIAAIFLCEGAALGAVGTTLGVLGGFVTSWLIGKYHLIHLPPDLFMVSAVPVRLYAVNFIAVAIAAVILCAVGAIYPALQARSLSPVEVIRYE